MFELIYTSSPRGLLPGRSGFTTVATTAGMPPNMVLPLENLSGYNFTYRDGTLPEELNPPCCYYIKMRYGNQMLAVAGRVAPCGLDYSKRNNKIAHHLLFEETDELSQYPGGIAELFMQEDFFCSEYKSEPQELPFRSLPFGSSTFSIQAHQWQATTGESGFAAWVANRFSQDPSHPVYLKYPAGTPINILLNLLIEVCVLLDKNERQEFTFSTYFSTTGGSNNCFLRMIPDFSPLLSNLRRFHQQDLLELDNAPALPPGTESSVRCQWARTGRMTENIPESTVEVVRSAYNDDTDAINLQDDQHSTPVYMVLDDPPRKPQLPKRPAPISLQYRQLLLMAVTGLFVLAVLCLMLFMLKSPVEKNNKLPVVPENPARSTGKQHSAAAPGINTPGTNSQPAKTVSAPADKTLPPVEKKPADPQVNKPAQPAKPQVKSGNLLAVNKTLRQKTVRLKTQDALQLFMAYQRVNMLKDNSFSLVLPPALSAVQEVYVEISHIGTATVDSEKFVRPASPRGSVCIVAGQNYPPQPWQGPTAEAPQLLITIEQHDRALKFQFISSNLNCTMPDLQKITRFYFRTADKVYCWDTKFKKSYLKAVKPGTIRILANGRLQYKKSAQEKALSGFIQIYIGDCLVNTFNSSKFNIAEWNNAVKKYKLTTAKLKKQQDLHKKLVHYPDKQPTRKSFNQTKSDLMKLADNGELKIVNKNLVSQMKLFFAQDLSNSSEYAQVEKDLKDLIDELHEELKDEIKASERKSLAACKANWDKTYNDLINFKNLTVNINNLVRQKLNDLNQLKNKERQINSIAKRISPRTTNLLKKLMTEAKGKDFMTSPAILSEQALQTIAADMTSQIRITILDNAEGR